MQNSVNFTFVEQLRVFGFDRFEFYGDFFARCHVGPEVNVTKRTAPNLPPQAVLPSHTQLHGCNFLVALSMGLLTIMEIDDGTRQVCYKSCVVVVATLVTCTVPHE